MRNDSGRIRGLYVWVSAAALAAGCSQEKSEHPLSPTVAGPIPGVSISAPSIVEPAQGARIAVANQPISITVQNATTNFVRPLSYLFEVAVDANFNNKVFTRDQVQPGQGKTTMRLSDSLAAERSYYWRVRASDGVNTGPYAGPWVFDVYTPVVIGRPTPVWPTRNVTTNYVQPTFTVVNAPRSGPVGRISYQLQVANDSAFANLFAVWQFPETPGQTSLAAPSQLAGDKQYFWRIRAYDSNSVIGPWTDTQLFKTPAPAPAPAPPPPSGGGGRACTPYAQPIDVVSCRRAQYPARLSPGQAPALLADIARDLNTSRPAYYGRLSKTSGNNCGGFSCDIICETPGTNHQLWDVFGDGPDAGANYAGAATPQWGDKGTNGSACVVP
jgi:hypothetical protein